MASLDTTESPLAWISNTAIWRNTLKYYCMRDLLQCNKELKVIYYIAKSCFVDISPPKRKSQRKRCQWRSHLHMLRIEKGIYKPKSLHKHPVENKVKLWSHSQPYSGLKKCRFFLSSRFWSILPRTGNTG